MGRQSRRTFNKNWGKTSTNQIKANLGVTVGTLAAAAGLGAIRSRRARKEWEKKQKTYAQKKDDKYYQGEETDYQKKMRKGGSRFIVGTGLVSGAGMGSILSKSEVLDAQSRVNRENLAESLERLDLLKRAPNIEILELTNRDDRRAREAAANYERRIGKLAKKKLVSGGLKGAAIGGTIGGLAAYGNNNSVKTMHEKLNANRRHRPKKKD